MTLPQSHRPLLGILIMLIGISMLSGMDVLVKLLSTDYSVVQLLFFRSLFALPVIVAFAFWEGGAKALRTQRPMLHVSRGLFVLATAACFFYSFKHLPLADAYTLIFSSPLILTLLAVPLLGERVGLHRALAVMVGFSGVVIAMQPGFQQGEIATWIALMGALLYALILVFIRQMSRTETTAAIVFYSTLVMALVAGCLMPFYWHPIDAHGLMMMVLIGLIGGMGQLFLTLAFRLAHASLLAPYEYVSLIWGVIYGFLVFGDIPAASTFLGGAIIVVSGLYVIQRETRAHTKSEAIAVSTDPAIAPVDTEDEEDNRLA
jgi:drug/metabolite transporter (DMT)-like permease